MKLPVSTSTGRRSRSGTSIQPIRQPVIEKYFENEPKTTASRLVSHARAGRAAARRRAGRTRCRGRSRRRSAARRCASHHGAIAASSSGSSMVPVGLAGLATTSPLMVRSSCARAARRSAGTGSPGPHGISTTSQPERGQHVAVAGVAGPRDRHPVAGARRPRGTPAGSRRSSRSSRRRRRRRRRCRARAGGGRRSRSRSSGMPGGRRCSRAGRRTASSRIASAFDRRRRAGARLAGDEVDQVAVGALALGRPPPAGPSRGTAARWRAAPRPAKSACHEGSATVPAACRPARRPKNDPSPSWVPDA